MSKIVSYRCNACGITSLADELEVRQKLPNPGPPVGWTVIKDVSRRHARPTGAMGCLQIEQQHESDVTICNGKECVDKLHALIPSLDPSFKTKDKDKEKAK